MARKAWRWPALAVLLTACGGRLAQHASGNAALAWITTRDQVRLLSREADIAILSMPDTSRVVIDVDETKVYQEMVGFGAAMTDAAAFLINNKLGAQRDAILRELFGRDGGLGLSFVRVPLGASDFSSTHYSYDDVPAGDSDPGLARFSIAADRRDKLSVLRAAMAINPRLTLVGSPWSAPGWMKTSGSLMKGTLRPEMYEPFANYLRSIVQAYASEGVPLFALTLQNEPAHEPDNYPGMRLDAASRAALIGRYVGPLFTSNRMTTQILEWDHNWDAPAEPLGVLGDSVARKYVSGVAWHCYAGDPSVQESVHAAYPTKDTYFTECSGGSWAPVFGDNLVWNVSTLIINSVRGWAKGVSFWNLALDETGGPHLGGCGNCRGVITIDSKTGAVTRNVEYYVLAHASKFVRPGAHRIASSNGVGGLQTVAFKNADDGSKVLIVLNASPTSVSFVIRNGGRSIPFSMPAGAVATLLWR